MGYIIDQTKLKAKNTVIESLRQEITQISYQVSKFEQALPSLVTAYFERGISSTGDQVISELERAKNRVMSITSDLELAIILAEKLSVLTQVEDDNEQPNSGYY